MILLSEIEVTNSQSVAGSSTTIKDLDFIAIDPWSVVLVKSLKDVDGKSIGSRLFISEGVGIVLVSEEMTDVMRMVEYGMKDNDDDHDEGRLLR